MGNDLYKWNVSYKRFFVKKFTVKTVCIFSSSLLLKAPENMNEKITVPLNFHRTSHHAKVTFSIELHFTIPAFSFLLHLAGKTLSKSLNHFIGELNRETLFSLPMWCASRDRKKCKVHSENNSIPIVFQWLKAKLCIQCCLYEVNTWTYY